MTSCARVSFISPESYVTRCSILDEMSRLICTSLRVKRDETHSRRAILLMEKKIVQIGNAEGSWGREKRRDLDYGRVFLDIARR